MSDVNFAEMYVKLTDRITYLINKLNQSESDLESCLLDQIKFLKEYNQLLADHRILKYEYDKLKHENNPYNNIGLSKDDIKILLALCHPDKHDGKRIAQDMTAKLLKLRS